MSTTYDETGTARGEFLQWEIAWPQITWSLLRLTTTGLVSETTTQLAKAIPDFRTPLLKTAGSYDWFFLRIVDWLFLMIENTIVDWLLVLFVGSWGSRADCDSSLIRKVDPDLSYGVLPARNSPHLCTGAIPGQTKSLLFLRISLCLNEIQYRTIDMINEYYIVTYYSYSS